MIVPGDETHAAVLVDSHCHIDMPQFDADRDAVVVRAREAGVANMLIVGGVDEEAGHHRALRVARELGLPCSAGVHPHEAGAEGLMALPAEAFPRR